MQILDSAWKEHLLQLDHLRQGIGLRAYAQRDPLNEYKREAFNLFEQMLHDLREKVTSVLAHVELRVNPAETEDVLAQQAPRPMHETREDPAFSRNTPQASDTSTTWNGTSRNAPCPCGSGKKYKHCHGAAA